MLLVHLYHLILKCISSSSSSLFCLPYSGWNLTYVDQVFTNMQSDLNLNSVSLYQCFWTYKIQMNHILILCSKGLGFCFTWAQSAQSELFDPAVSLVHHLLSTFCHILSQILMKLGQNVYLDDSSDKFKNVGSKIRSIGKILENLLYALEATFSI